MLSYFTSESVTCGHPDKLCDRIADSILDEILYQDPLGHVACEVTATKNKLHIMGEISANSSVDYEAVAREVIAITGYTEVDAGFDSRTCSIRVDIHEQSPDIARSLQKKEPLDCGAGDQGTMIGFACRETKNLMPFPIEYAHKLARRLDEVRMSGKLPYIRPDGKTQITVEYEHGRPKRIASVIVSAQHYDHISIEQLRKDIEEYVILPVLPEAMLDHKTTIYINPAGRFVIGGPAADTGLTGRKNMVDTYGGYARCGGGSLSGKDATKVDRSGAYMARYLAKNIVASDIADRCEVQISYAIGLAEPVAFNIDDFNTGRIPMERVKKAILRNIDMRPMAIIRRLKLNRPIYSKLACYGHFGENAKDMPWEKCDLADQLSKLL